MSLQRVIAAPFKQSGSQTLTEQELVVGLSLHRDWFSPDQAKRVVKRAEEEGLLTVHDSGLEPSFILGDVNVPRNFSPDESILTTASPFERMLEQVVASGDEKREAVAAINRLQRDLDITIEAAAAIYASSKGLDVRDEIDAAARALRESEEMRT